ncbi:MAG: hypothetical protein NC453_28140, partial [Muribaculum sp.]|nr:hypothetical protein [Muribaculum sp.]
SYVEIAGSKKSNANIGVLKRSLRKQAKDKYWNYKPKDAIDGPMDSNKAPKEGMYFEYHIMAWVPKSFDKEIFEQEKAEVIEAEYQRLLDITPNPNNPGFSLSGKSLSTYCEETADNEDEELSEHEETTSTVNQGEWYTSIIVEPDNEAQPKVKSPLEDVTSMPLSESTDSVSPAEIPEASDAVTSLVQENPSSESVPESQPEAVEQSKKTRQSAKMVASDFDTLAAQFIYPTDLGEKKPLFFPEKIRESLRKIAGLVPGGKVSPSHIAIHIIEVWIDERRDLFNRMFANQKTSI